MPPRDACSSKIRCSSKLAAPQAQQKYFESFQRVFLQYPGDYEKPCPGASKFSTTAGARPLTTTTTARVAAAKQQHRPKTNKSVSKGNRDPAALPPKTEYMLRTPQSSKTIDAARNLYLSVHISHHTESRETTTFGGPF